MMGQIWDKIIIGRNMTEETIKVGSGTVVKRQKKDKTFSYQAKVRKSGVNASQTFDTLKKAKDFITTTESKILTGEPVTSSKVRKTLLKEIFREYVEFHPEMATNKAQRLGIISKEIGDVPLDGFKTLGFQKYINAKLKQEIPDQATKKKRHKNYNGNRVVNEKGEEVKKTFQPSTVRHYYYAIRTALQWHAKAHDYTFNTKPFDEVEPPASWGSPRERRLEDGELERLIQATSKLYKHQQATSIVIRFLAYSAFRVGETLKIKWKDLKLNFDKPEESYIFIPKANQKIAKKKGAENRYASLRPELFYLVKDEVMPWKTDSVSDDDYVFPFWNTPSYFSNRFKIVCNNAKVKNLRVHDLRHEGCSWFFENTTLSDIEISKITGHIELDTLKKYSQLRPHKVGQKLWSSLEKR
jgi:integrase